jgi:hypothetical protein
MSKLDEAIIAAQSLEPDDRLRLIARLWALLPPDHWAAPSAEQMADVQRLINEYDSGRTGEAPWGIASTIFTRRTARAPVSKLYSAPRRFDLATIFVVTTAYAILFSGMTVLTFPPAVSVCVALYITMVGIGQATLFFGSRPRLASMIAGGIAYCILGVGLWLMNAAIYNAMMLPILLVNAFIGGALLGYPAGVLIGGVFLVADVLRQQFKRNGTVEIDQPPELD